ncbi:23S rRNA (guanosine(2251)-2'-O)-methyltransferase RlmB [Candidatus Providencia siddallii]|uniref:23S rRNA (Guanosine-2'-O-)-methyltransferase RlmB n=1 Tax=Candidatus Providencia siddallii TaxID=1715285 RepID=A0ABM9NPW3_9GAMM
MTELIYGFHAINAILEKSPKRIKEFYYSNEKKNYKVISILKKIKTLNITVIKTNRKWINEQIKKTSNQGCFVKVTKNKEQKESDLIKIIKNTKTPFLLALDCITDPYNLGACLRSANAAGINAVIIPKDKSAKLNSTVKKVACGAVENTPIFRVTNLVRTLCLLKNNNIRIIGTTVEKTKNTIYQCKLTDSIILVMGSENKGLRHLTKKHCNELINIPTIGSISSLNVSVATGICLFEAIRQRLFIKNK